MSFFQIASVFGAVSGGLSLLFLVIMVGVYKERIDRHERLFRVMESEALAQALRRGKVESGSFKSKPEVIASLPPRCLEACEKVARKCSKDSDYSDVSKLLLKVLDPEVLANASIGLGLTPMELLGTLTVYTVELVKQKAPSA